MKQTTSAAPSARDIPLINHPVPPPSIPTQLLLSTSRSVALHSRIPCSPRLTRYEKRSRRKSAPIAGYIQTATRVSISHTAPLQIHPPTHTHTLALGNARLRSHARRTYLTDIRATTRAARPRLTAFTWDCLPLYIRQASASSATTRAARTSIYRFQLVSWLHLSARVDGRLPRRRGRWV